MQKLLWAYLKNAARARLTGSSAFDPLWATLYVTPLCNLRCTYCVDFGAQKNDSYRGQTLSSESLERILDLLAVECQLLYITGGEPTLRSDLTRLLQHARRRGFGFIALNTNGLLLRDHAAMLDHLDTLVISIDSLQVGRHDPVLAQQPDTRQKLLDNVRWAAAQQKSRGFTLTLTTVVMPGRLDEARGVRDFCYEIGAEFSCQGVSIDRLPSPELAADPEYRRFLDELIADKRLGKGVSGSELYLRGVRDRAPFRCTPTAAPHVDWLGRLAFPCRELPDHVLVDLLAAGSYRAALAEGERRYGAAPTDCMRCGERCYVEVSTLVRQPTALGRELVGYARQLARHRDAKANLPAPLVAVESGEL